MYDPKVIRRRRATLAVLVISSLVLLTAYFGESEGGGGPLQSLQRGVGDVISPVQSVATTAVKPVRDLVGWIGDTWTAKGENEDLRKERDELRRAAIDGRNAVRENKALQKMLDLDETLSLEDYAPVTARVIGQSPTLWFATIKISKGSGDGLRKDLPVVATDGKGAGLIGKVTDVSGGNAIVTLVTDSAIRVSAIPEAGGPGGIIGPKLGDPRTLELRSVPTDQRIEEGTTIVTKGTSDPEYSSLFPRGIPVGKVSRVDDPGTDGRKIFVRPFVDLRSIAYVQVLTAGLGRAE